MEKHVMRLQIVNYGHPVLRQKGTRIDSVNDDIHRLVSDMLETMHAAAGVGLAAQQVAHALQLTVVDVRGVEDRPSTLEIAGQSVDPSAHMPLVLINPEIKTSGDLATGPEGCLSFPEIYAEITRPESVAVKALNEKGEWTQYACGGLLSRAIQHEYDHLQGILFIDRMSRETKQELQKELDGIQAETKAWLKAEAEQT